MSQHHEDPHETLRTSQHYRIEDFKEGLYLGRDFIDAERLASFGIMRAILEPSVHHNTIVLRALRRAFNWGPIMPREASPSDSQSEILPSGSLFNWLQSFVTQIFVTRIIFYSYVCMYVYIFIFYFQF